MRPAALHALLLLLLLAVTLPHNASARSARRFTRAGRPGAGCGRPFAARLAWGFGDGMVLSSQRPCVAGTATGPVAVRLLRGGRLVAEANVTLTAPAPATGTAGPAALGGGSGNSTAFLACFPAPLPPSQRPAQVAVHPPECPEHPGGVALRNVLVGSVFYCFGQSNMAMPLAESCHDLRVPTAECVRAVPPGLRLLDAKRGAAWANATTAAALRFSAACWHFGLMLEQLQRGRHTPVPIGLVHNSASSNPISAFLRSLGPCVPGACRTVFPGECRHLLRQRAHGWANRDSARDLAAAYRLGVLRPAERLAVDGFLFYQGESDIALSTQYDCRQRRLLAQIRAVPQWRHSAFVSTLIAPLWSRLFMNLSAMVREQQLLLVRQNRPPRVAVVSALDLGVRDEIHPPDKASVGRRLAEAMHALHFEGVNPLLLDPVAMHAAVAVSGGAGAEVTATIEFGHALERRGTAGCAACCAAHPFLLAAPAPGAQGGLDPAFHGASALHIDRGLVTVRVTLKELPALPWELFYQYADAPECGLYSQRTGQPVMPFRLSITALDHATDTTGWAP